MPASRIGSNPASRGPTPSGSPRAFLKATDSCQKRHPDWQARARSRRLGTRRPFAAGAGASFPKTETRPFPRRRPLSFTGHSQARGRMRTITNHQGDEMSDQTTKGRNRKLMMLGGLGLGLAMLGRKRRWRRYAMSQMMGGGYAGGPWGRFGGYGHGGPGGPQHALTLPPLILAAPEGSAAPAP